jgi:hypothetical protein
MTGMDLPVRPGADVWYVWRDGDGISRQKKVQFADFELTTFIEGMTSIWKSDASPKPTKIFFLTLVPGVDYGWHENPAPQWIVPISGRWFVETMDGARVEMGPGELSFGADQNCRLMGEAKGHRSGAVGPEEAVLMLIQVESDPFAERSL